MALPPATLGGSASSVVRIIITADDRASATFSRVADQAGQRLRSRIVGLNAEFRGLDRIWTLIALGSGASLIKTFIGFAAQLQKTSLQIAVFTRDMEAVPHVMEQIFQVARKAPLDLNTITDVFVRMKASGIEPIIDDQGNGPLKNLIDAVTAFGGGSEIFKRAGIAIQQMAGKGVISMEELRQQLGEAVPTAMRVMANQMDISVSELIRQVTRGELEFEKGFKALDEGFKKFFGGAAELQLTTFLGALQQTKRAFQELSDILNKSGALDFFTAAITLINDKIDEFNDKLKTPEGISLFQDNIIRFAEIFAGLTTPLADLVSIISSVGRSVMGLIGSLPEEIIGGGIVGLIIFGRFIGPARGLAAGILFSQFSEVIQLVVRFVTLMIDSFMTTLTAIGMDPGNIVQGGLVGFVLFGRKGSLIGLALGVFTDVIEFVADQITSLVIQVEGGIANIKAQFKATMQDPLLFFDPAKLNEIGEIAEKNREAWLRSVVEMNREAGKLKVSGLFEMEEDDKRKIGDYGQSVKDLAQKLKDLAGGFAAVRDENVKSRQALEDLGGLTKEQLNEVGRFATTLEKLEARAGGAGAAMRKFAIETETKISKAVKISEQLAATIERMDQEGASVKAISGLKKEFDDLNKNIARAKELLDKIVGEDSARHFDRISEQIKRLSENLDPFLTRGKEDMTALELAVEKVEARFAGYRNTVETLTSKIEKSIVVDELKAKALLLIANIQKKLNDAQEAALRSAEKEVELAAERQLVRAQEAVTATTLKTEILEMEVAFDKVGLAAARAEARIATLTKVARTEILKLKKAVNDGLNKEQNEALIKVWEELLKRIEEAGEKLREHMEFNASEFGKFMNTFASSLEGALANAIEALATRTGSAKDIILAFYRDITAALSRYLAAQALIAVFGASSGSGLGFTFGSLFSGLFGAEAAPAASAQTGGSFIVGGAGSADSKLALMKLSPGERVDVTPPGEARPGGGSDGGGTIVIQALDGASVMRVLAENQREIVGLFQGRRRINRLGTR